HTTHPHSFPTRRSSDLTTATPPRSFSSGGPSSSAPTAPSPTSWPAMPPDAPAANGSTPSAAHELEHLDVLVIGAGLSGIGAGWYLQDRCPWASYAIFEARDSIGGTWDLFRHTGVRSDSDMFTLD